MRLIRTSSLVTISAALVIPALAGAPTPSADAQKTAFPDPRFVVNGLPWFEEDKPIVRRLPARLKETFREPVWALAQQPSGGRIRFRTDSTRVGIVAQNPDASVMEHITSIGQNGFDCYADGEYIGSAYPTATGNIVREWIVGIDRKVREITIYMPLYKAVTIQTITLEPNSKIEAPNPFAVAKPVVYYGSSITQGGCASNAGLSCQAIIGRDLNADFVNLGFSGQGIGDESVAKAMTEIDASCVVLDYWANPNAKQFKSTLPGFVDILRAKFPKIPIIITGPYYNTRAATNKDQADQCAAKAKIAREFVEARRQAGDAAITFVDGTEMLSREQAIGLVDGLHCNSLGFYFCAMGLEPHLRKALNLPAAATSATRTANADVTEGPALPFGVAAHAGGKVGGVPVIAGGSSWSDDKKTKLRRRETLVIVNDKWTPGPMLPRALSDLAFASDEHGLCVAGGTDGTSGSTEVLRLAGIGADATWEKMPSLPEPIESAAGAIRGGTFYVVGGFSDGKESDRLWALDMSKPGAQWKACAPVPAKGRAYPALLAHGDFLYLFGGYAGPPGQQQTEIFGDAYRYDPKLDRWEKLAGFDLPGFGWSAVSVDADNVMLTGRIDGSNQITDDVWLLDLKNPKPAVIAKLITPTCCAAPVQMAADTWWIIGGEPDIGRSRTPRVSVVRLVTRQ